jgi:hypothetical protein
MPPPTAVHAVAETQSAPCSDPPVSPAGSGTIVGTQPVADSVSTNGTPSDSPTAVHAEAETHDTLHSNVQFAPLGRGGDTDRQAVPDRVSTTGAAVSKDVG